ncbi:MAG: CapA family protein, partial [Candidatus Taylorbacteria bacterium]|nr:CapA family protein [Candidatus Taylorbacteria bacterium]
QGRSGILLAGSPDFEKIIRKAARAVDVLIVGFHWGEEYKVRSGKRERELARRAVDAGAALVVGHHPHLPQEVEIYRNAPIFYSLGNFIFDQNLSKETMSGLVVEVTLKEGRIHAWRTQKVVLDKTFRPSLVEIGE